MAIRTEPINRPHFCIGQVDAGQFREPTIWSFAVQKCTPAKARNCQACCWPIHNRPHFNQYLQTIGDTPEEAGHEDLSGPKGEWLGWVMPPDPATDALVEATKDKVVFEIESGSGKCVVQPTLENGAGFVFTIDIFKEHLQLVERIADKWCAKYQPWHIHSALDLLRRKTSRLTAE